MSPNSIVLILVALAGLVILLLITVPSRFQRSVSLRARIALGILVTGGVAIGFLSVYAVNSATQIANSLSNRLETSVQLLAEEQLINTVNTEAGKANQSFEKIEGDVVELANHWSALYAKQSQLAEGSYWDAATSLTPMEGGKYGNSTEDISAVYVPAKATLNDSALNDLNTSAYLDFSAPSALSSNPSLLAVYAIDTRGITRYYPNINIASLVPADFDPTERAYYRITSPLFNPAKEPRWAIPYLDATGGGLVVTVTAPVYNGETFKGIIGADMQLAVITSQIEQIKVGQSGYAFMIDDAGRIISMPPAGYQLFGITPESVNSEDYFKTTIMGAGSPELVEITNRMAAGGNGLVTLPIAGADTYIAFAPVRSNGYSVGIVAPVAELQTAIAAARNETQTQIRSAARLAALILAGLLAAAVALSLRLSYRITEPIAQLTDTANAIVSGDLTAQATVNSRDEIGTLANAFNTMTNRLSETLAGLEQRVADRTAALTVANRQIEERAAQLETIARVAHTIGSTRDLDELLPQIAKAISAQFGFYHVGIFLLDARKEYATLSAANSEGGKKMLESNHKLKVGETGIVGFVTATGKPRVALDTGADAVFFNNPFLPETRSEIALPLIAGQETLGALDVQSVDANAFGEQDIHILSILAGQVSVAIQNSLQFEETQKALAEAEALSRQLTRAGWREFAKGKKLLGIRHSGARATLLYAKRNGKPTEGFEATDDQSLSKPRGAALSIPIKLRGETIGTVDVRAPANRRWDQDEMDIVTAIIERAALALENARFLEESQKRAAKEKTIGEISAKISAHSAVDELLKTAALELSRSLPGAEVAIQFNKDQEAE
ncbi:MAG: GAF domain-containing protein [Anaerolineales bacterium]|nr:GAF domain-containing protein [Anaerolineales bacterium]